MTVASLVLAVREDCAEREMVTVTVFVEVAA
jgi:hypothetical protein